MKNYTTSGNRRQLVPISEETELRSWKLGRWVFLSLDLSLAEKAVLYLLCEYANRDLNWTAWPTLATLTRFSGTSEGTVRRALRSLEQKGLITVTRTKTLHTITRDPRTVNHYQLNLRAFEQQSLVYPAIDQGDQLASDHSDQLASDQGDRQIRVDPDPAIEDPAITNPNTMAGWRPDTYPEYELTKAEALEILDSIPQYLLNVVAALERFEDNPTDEPIRYWAIKMLRLYGTPKFKRGHGVKYGYKGDTVALWTDLIFFGAIEAMRYHLGERTEPIEHLRAYIQSCAGGWEGPTERYSEGRLVWWVSRLEQ